MIGMHIIFLLTDCLNKTLCQSAVCLFSAYLTGSDISILSVSNTTGTDTRPLGFRRSTFYADLGY